MFVAEPGTIPPSGPLRPAAEQTAAELSAAWASSGLLLSLVHLDPMLGAGHLVSWAPGAAVLVTAGQSTWTRVQAVGEMIRLGGVHLVSAILLGADKGDESLGLTHGPADPHGAPYAPAASLYANGLAGSANGRPARAPHASPAAPASEAARPSRPGQRSRPASPAAPASARPAPAGTERARPARAAHNQPGGKRGGSGPAAHAAVTGRRGVVR